MNRDINRIEELCTVLEDVWLTQPELRFNQLLYILQSKDSEQNNNVGKVCSDDGIDVAQTGFDFFNVEDSDFIAFLKKVRLEGL